MRIGFLHLSDVHFTRDASQNPVLDRSDSIGAAFSSVAYDVRYCFVVVTGDVSASGQEEEYRTATEFFGRLRSSIETRFGHDRLRFIFVPGNHDCDMSRSDPVRQLVIDGLRSCDADASLYATCIGVQANFRAFAVAFTSSPEVRGTVPQLYRRERHDLGDVAVDFCLLNTAWMSRLDEQQGTLRFPVDLLTSDCQFDEAPNLVVSVLHHPYNWLQSTNARQLRDQIEKSCDIVLSGHEHDGDHHRVTASLGQTLDYVVGGILQDANAPNASEFNVVIVDLERSTQTLHPFTWDGTTHYSCEAPEELQFLPNRYRLRNQYALTDRFSQYLDDIGAKFSHPYKATLFLRDLFVYPDVRRIGFFREDERSSELLDRPLPLSIVEGTRMLLVGPDKCGKTALAKRLFCDLLTNEVVPILVSGDKFRDPSPDSVRSVVEHAFLETYASPDFGLFMQLQPSQRVIIVDDFDHCRLRAPYRDRVVTALQALFDRIVLLGSEGAMFDDFLTQRRELPSLWDFTRCGILPFGHARRDDLIRNWHDLGRRSLDDNASLDRRVAASEKLMTLLLGRNLIPAYPIFMLILLQQMELAVPLETGSQSGSYGFLYEALLTRALAQLSRRSLSLDTLYNYLTQLAWRFFSLRREQVDLDDMRQWHRDYCDDYRVRLDLNNMLPGLADTGMLRIEEDSIFFRYPYVYYYFVARYLRDHLAEEDIRHTVSSLTAQLNHAESANIVLFLCYLSKDQFIISSMLDASRALFSRYDECDLDEDTRFIQALMTQVSQLVLDERYPERRRRDILAETDRLEQATPGGSDDALPSTEEGPQPDALLQQHLQINVAFKTIQIMGQILRGFAGSIRAPTKAEIAGACYSLGLRVLKCIFESVESEQEAFVQYLVMFLGERHPTWSFDKLTGELSEILLRLPVGAAFVLVKYVGDSVGLYELALTYDDVLKTHRTVSRAFIDLSVRLDQFPDYPKQRLFSLLKDVHDNLFAYDLLRHLAWYDFYIYRRPESIRQSVCTTLGIKLLPATIHDPRAKRPR